MSKETASGRTRIGLLAVAGVALVSLAFAPTLGSAALDSGHFKVKATNTENSEITAIAGQSGNEGAEIPEVPVTGESNQMIFILDTRFEGCTTPRLYLTGPDTPSTVIDWGDGTPTTGVTPGTHSYATPGEYKVTVTGKVEMLRSVPVESANCFKSLEYIGPDSGLVYMLSSFEGAAHIRHVAAPPSSVTYMGGLFKNSGFNGDISGWNTSNVTNMSFMFDGATKFNRPIGGWDVSKVTRFGMMFNGATSFNQPIGGWDMTSASMIDGMFQNATSFNQDLPWTTPNITTIGAIFSGATSFNGDISNWDVSKVANFTRSFKDAKSFNGDISRWNVSTGGSFDSMFENAEAFNRPIGNWKLTKGLGFRAMFKGAAAFDQDLSGWETPNLSAAQPEMWVEFAPHLDTSKIPAKFRNN